MNHKRRIKNVLILFTVIFVLAGILHYSNNVRAASAKLNKKSVTMWVGDTLQLKVSNTKDKVKWSSNKKSVATVSAKGKVKAKKSGKAVITAKVANKKLKCKITVIPGETEELTENGIYTSKEKVALYIHTYNKLPGNFITKDEAKALGWKGGSLLSYAPDKCIGGDRFSNYEGALPQQSGRIYYECDIDTLGALQRGAKRLVYSNDGLIYYTPDHYATFELLYN